ncbi:hypothetical protein BH11PLA1_BH11PLA1_13860 [soil metagenome]
MPDPTPNPADIINEPAPSRRPQWLQMLPRPRAHWNFRYLSARLALAAFYRRRPDAPWLAQGMVEFLSGYLLPGDTLVEFGSGRSTLWFARKVTPSGRIISIEHHHAWHTQITALLRTENIRNVDYRHTPEDAPSYLAAAAAALAAAPSPSSPAAPKADIILVDGIHREKCVLWALDHIKPGGAIILDNANWFIPNPPVPTHSPPKFGTHPQSQRPEWATFVAATQGWRRYWTTNDISDTAAYFAPI